MVISRPLASTKVTGSSAGIGLALAQGLAGAGAAVVLRVGLTFVAAQLLVINYVKLVGGLLLLWIAVKLLVDNTGEQEQGRPAAGLGQAVWLILVADITMSLDNVLAVAGASRGSLALLIFGLALSIPLVVFTSNLLARLMDRYVALVYGGAAILGKVAGDMIMTDRLVADHFHPAVWVVHTVEVLLAAGVILLVALLARYWHFLLLVWVILFAMLGWMTPDVVRAICGTLR